MTRRYLSILLTVLVFALSSCSQQPAFKMPTEADFLPDLEENPALTQSQLSDNERIKADYLKQKDAAIQVASADLAEQKEVAKLQTATQQAEEELGNKILDAIKDDEVKELLAQSDVSAMVEQSGSKEELIQTLRESTDLDETAIQKLAEFREIQIEVASAEDSEELQRILEENTSLSVDEITEIVEEKKQLTQEKQEIKSEILAKIYERLKRNRETGTEDAFCARTAQLDQFIISPVYYEYDSFTVDKGSAETLFNQVIEIYDEVSKYEGLILQVEGNCDERGSNAYNKALGDKRWSSAAPFLTSQAFDEEDIVGVSKGEECQTERKSDSFEEWWKENRRVDFIWVLR